MDRFIVFLTDSLTALKKDLKSNMDRFIVQLISIVFIFLKI